MTESGYARMPGDTYVTPGWVYHALYTVEPWAKDAWDCAPVNADFDFLSQDWPQKQIASNPPFNRAVSFCRHALEFASKIAFLLPIYFDAAGSRRDLFADNKSFKAKYTLTKRIRWQNLEQKKAPPRHHHCWYVWDHSHNGPPTMGWL